MTQQLGLARTTAVLEISNSTAMRLNSCCHLPARYDAAQSHPIQGGIKQWWVIDCHQMWCQLTGCFLMKDSASLLGEGARSAPVVQAAIIVEVLAVVVAQGAAAVSGDVQSPAHLPPALASEDHGPDESGHN